MPVRISVVDTKCVGGGGRAVIKDLAEERSKLSEEGGRAGLLDPPRGGGGGGGGGGAPAARQLLWSCPDVLEEKTLALKEAEAGPACCTKLEAGPAGLERLEARPAGCGKLLPKGSAPAAPRDGKEKAERGTASVKFLIMSPRSRKKHCIDATTLEVGFKLNLLVN